MFFDGGNNHGGNNHIAEEHRAILTETIPSNTRRCGTSRDQDFSLASPRRSEQDNPKP